jgi:hypothetical protein
MPRRLLACTVAALAAAPAALAGGPNAGVINAGSGVAAKGGGDRYVTLWTKHETAVEAISTTDGRVLRSTTLPGRFAVPAVTFNGEAGGLSSNGTTLVLGDASTGNGRYPLKRRSSFAILTTKPLRLQTTVTLRGDFAFDALSPDASKLYLIQHVSAQNLDRYVVRAYDLEREVLLPGRIADRTQRDWVMQGAPVGRATSAGGRWVYTLYQNPGGYPFVHALDAVNGTAHCIGLPWTGKQDALWKLRLSLRDGGRTLDLRWPGGRPYLAVAVGSWRISHPVEKSAGFPWWILAVAVGGGAALVAGGLALRGSRRRLAGPLPSPSA